MNDKTQLYGAHPEPPTAVLCSCAPKLAEFAQRIATLEALVNEQHTPTLNEHDDRLDRVEIDVKRLIEMKADVVEVKAGIAEILTWKPHFLAVAEVKRALDIGAPDPDPTPNMRGGR